MSKLAILIDDDKDDLELMEEVLQQIDSTLRYMRFSYPEEAMDALLRMENDQPPDYIFMDINMPKISGDMFLSMLRKRDGFNRCVITLYSTSMPEQTAQLLIRSGADHVFEKPVHMEVYFDVLQKILSGDRQAQPSHNDPS